MTVMGAFAGERIRAARQMLGISQTELAEAVGVGQSMISQVENGSRTATEDLLAAVARTTGTPRSFFDTLPPDLPTGTLRFRKLASARAGDTRRAKVLFDEAYRVVVQLMQEAGLESPALPVVTGHLDSDDVERLALEARDALGLSGGGPVRHVTRLCERANIVVAPLVLPGVEDDESDAVGHFGMSMWPGSDEPALVGYFAVPAGDRQRFTLAHELGHLLLHSRRSLVASPEDEANRFAGAFLFPRDRAEDALGQARLTLTEFAHLKARWGMSIQAIIMRGAHLGLIDKTRKTSLFKQLSARGWRKQEPVVVHVEEPVLLWKLLAAKVGKPVSYPRAGEAVGLQPVVLRALAPQPPRQSPSSPWPAR